MKLLSFLFILITASFYVKAQGIKSEPVVVIELFTSQGCSSCPSADRLLANLAQNTNGQEIYGLSFHVSYWNRLGWTDPYSSEQFTLRQRKYGSVMNLRTIYTPQMIVNGTYEFVGSNKSKADFYIDKALDEPLEVEILLEDVKIKNDLLSFQYTIKEDNKDSFLNVAIVEKQVENHVPRGENRGLTLKHENVVRQFKAFDSATNGIVNYDIEKSFDLNNCDLIIYLQDKRHLKIYAARKIEISSIN